MQLQDRINKGEELSKRLQQVASIPEIDTLGKERATWDEYNHELLSRMFNTLKYAEEYIGSDVSVSNFHINPSPATRLSTEIDELDKAKRRLQSILERLPLIYKLSPQIAETVPPEPGNKVFIVHGHDATLKLEVARFIEKLQLEAIVLSEQANQGKTIIEKFEAHAETVDFAVVLLTPDDVGGAKGGDTKSRARQNVILELGYFIGKIGRQKVCALFKSGVELPSDILGVVYVSADEDWRLPLAKEMKTAGLLVNLNLAV